MVRLHVLHDQIIRLTIRKRVLEIVEPFMLEARVDRIEHGDFLIFHNVGIVCHAVRNDILSLEQIDRMVVDADIQHSVGHMIQVHILSPCGYFLSS